MDYARKTTVSDDAVDMEPIRISREGSYALGRQQGRQWNPVHKNCGPLDAGTGKAHCADLLENAATALETASATNSRQRSGELLNFDRTSVCKGATPAS